MIPRVGISPKISTRFRARLAFWSNRAVTLASRAGLETAPLTSGSSTKTIGMDDVDFIAAASAFPPVTMTSTLSRTNSAAIAAKRSLRPSAHLY